jgi:hypothetical protein
VKSSASDALARRREVPEDECGGRQSRGDSRRRPGNRPAAVPPRSSVGHWHRRVGHEKVKGGGRGGGRGVGAEARAREKQGVQARRRRGLSRKPTKNQESHHALRGNVLQGKEVRAPVTRAQRGGVDM